MSPIFWKLLALLNIVFRLLKFLVDEQEHMSVQVLDHTLEK